MPRFKNIEPVDRYVGARMRARRKEIGMSQSELGSACDITFQQIQKYEKGVNRVGSSRLAELATALKVDVAYFFDGMPGSKKHVSNNGTSLFEQLVRTSDGIALAQAFVGITNKGVRHQIVELTRSIAAANA